MNEELWEAIVSCDQAYDGKFFYGVATTGIFCRPSCKSRNPKKENVQIFTTTQEALSAKFRPCKRCRPEHLHGADAELAGRVAEQIEQQYHEPLTLHVLADRMHVSPYHLHRTFKRLYGVTPAEFVQRTRLEVAKAMLSADRDVTVTEIALAVGFPNLAHFSTVFQKRIGCTPSEYRQREG